MAEPPPENFQLGVGPTPKHASPKLIETHRAMRQVLVERYELQGLSQRRIAEMLQVDAATVNRDLKVIREKRREQFGEMQVIEQRDLTLARLEEERTRVLAKMQDDPGDPTATPPRPARSAQLTAWQGERLLLAIEKQRAELLGLNVPQRVHLAEFPAAKAGDVEDLDEQTAPPTLADLLESNGQTPDVARALHELLPHLSN